MRKVITFGDLLKSKYEASLGPEGRGYLERMQNAAGRMQNLIQALWKYYSQKQTGRGFHLCRHFAGDPLKEKGVMENRREPITILMADDDQDDCLLVKDAFIESRLSSELHCVENGEVLMDYLHHRNRYRDFLSAPRPGIILLDLNMPKKDGREALREIKSDPGLRNIPIVVLTTSREEEDILKCYDLGANSYITKPATFQELVEMIKTLGKYWLEIVELPPERKETDE